MNSMLPDHHDVRDFRDRVRVRLNAFPRLANILNRECDQRPILNEACTCAADLHEELRLATGITYTVLRKEHAGPIDLQRLVHVSRLKHVRDRALRHAFFNAADRVAVVHPRILDPSKRDYIHLYRGDSKTLSESLDRIQRTASTILNAVSGG